MNHLSGKPLIEKLPSSVAKKAACGEAQWRDRADAGSDGSGRVPEL